MTLNKKKDLTRWNRAGLSEFRYVDGNAVTFLETLRLQLIEEFDQPDKPVWQDLLDRIPERPGESRLQTRKRLTKQYYDDRHDYAWEILRSFARSTHILGEYINAYANEAYLSTAVEWDNVRKLVGMLDYQPSPPASAETHLALIYKENTSGKMDKGFSVKNKPEDGEQTIVFETRDTLEGSDKINSIHLHQWDKNLTRLTYDPGTGTTRFFPDEKIEKINTGDLGILAGDTIAMPVEVTSIGSDTDEYVGLKLLPGSSWHELTLNEATLYLKPAFVSSPLANGENSAVVSQEIGVSENDIVFLDRDSGWGARQIMRSRMKHIEFTRDAQHSDVHKNIHRARILKKQNHPKLAGGKKIYLLPEDLPDRCKYFVDDQGDLVSADIVEQHFDDVPFQYLDLSHDGDLRYPDDASSGRIEQVRLEQVRFSGKPSEIASGTWALVNMNGELHARCIKKITIDEDWFSISLDSPVSPVSSVRSAFKLALKHKDYNKNNNTAWTGGSNDAATILELDDPNVAQHLPLGRTLICASDSRAFLTRLKDVAVTGSGIVQMYLSPPFHNDPNAVNFTRNNTIIHGNAVRATHGETQPEKVIGNGDASKPGQRFELPSDKISWVADAGFSTGVRADLQLYVGQRLWKQVEDLSSSYAEDHHYQVRVNEDDKLSVIFGDGRHARRLPTGIDNVRVRYRVGYGEDGNLPSGSLVKIKKPHRLIKNFVAPLDSSGGAEKESGESMREKGPATVLAMKRAVSLDDFTHLAARHSMVWQARTFEKMPDRPARQLIEVVVVAAGGETFVPGSDMAMLIKDYLTNHSPPDTPVSVVSYSPLYMKLDLTIMVDEQVYNKKQVEQAVVHHLKTHLDINHRSLGQALFRSEITALLEQVEGVENGHCTILADPYNGLNDACKPRFHKGEDGEIRKVSIRPSQLLYLNVDRYLLQIISKSYEI